MYTIYCDGLCIYSDNTSAPEVRLQSPQMEISENTSGSLSFTMPKCNRGYDKLTLLKSWIEVRKNNEVVFECRPINESKDFQGNRAITCEGVMGLLNDTIQPDAMYGENANPIPSEFFADIIRKHNELADAEKQFKVGTFTVSGEMKTETPEMEYDDEGKPYVEIYIQNQNTLDVLNDKLVSVGANEEEFKHLKGYLHAYRAKPEDTEFTIDYLHEPITTSSQTIELGKNLLDFTINYDETEFCTVLIPLGESLGDGEITGTQAYVDLVGTEIDDEDWLSPKDANYIINRKTYKQFGWIQKVHNFDDCTIPVPETGFANAKDLFTETKKFFENLQFGEMELQLSAVDMARLGVNVDDISYLDNVLVKSAYHGLNRTFPVLGVTVPLDNPSQASYTLGESKKTTTLSAYSSQAEKSEYDALADAVSKTDAKLKSGLERALDESSTLVKSATSGYVTLVQDTTGTHTMAIAISQGEDYKTTPSWYWTKDGLAFYKNGTDNAGASVSIDMTGRIVANDMVAGWLSANIIKGLAEAGSAYYDANGMATPTSLTLESNNFVLKSDSFKINDGNYWLEVINTSSKQPTLQITKDGQITIYNQSVSYSTFTASEYSTLYDARGRWVNMKSNGLTFYYNSQSASEYYAYGAMYTISYVDIYNQHNINTGFVGLGIMDPYSGTSSVRHSAIVFGRNTTGSKVIPYLVIDTSNNRTFTNVTNINERILIYDGAFITGHLALAMEDNTIYGGIDSSSSTGNGLLLGKSEYGQTYTSMWANMGEVGSTSAKFKGYIGTRYRQNEWGYDQYGTIVWGGAINEWIIGQPPSNWDTDVNTDSIYATTNSRIIHYFADITSMSSDRAQANLQLTNIGRVSFSNSSSRGITIAFGNRSNGNVNFSATDSTVFTFNKRITITSGGVTCSGASYFGGALYFGSSGQATDYYIGSGGNGYFQSLFDHGYRVLTSNSKPFDSTDVKPVLNTQEGLIAANVLIHWSNTTENVGSRTGATKHYVDLLTGNTGSDRRIKKNITELDDISEIYNQLKPVKYEFKCTSDINNSRRSGVHYGLIAQEVESIEETENLVYETDSMFVSESEECDSKIKNIAYEELHAFHIKMIQELWEANQELVKRVSELEMEVYNGEKPV